MLLGSFQVSIPGLHCTGVQGHTQQACGLVVGTAQPRSSSPGSIKLSGFRGSYLTLIPESKLLASQPGFQSSC